jgi:hypothetical protein
MEAPKAATVIATETATAMEAAETTKASGIRFAMRRTKGQKQRERDI